MLIPDFSVPSDSGACVHNLQSLVKWENNLSLKLSVTDLGKKQDVQPGISNHCVYFPLMKVTVLLTLTQECNIFYCY